MRTMTSQEIHKAIEVALIEVSRALASGAIDRRGRYYSDTELKARFGNMGTRRTRLQPLRVKKPA